MIRSPPYNDANVISSSFLQHCRNVVCVVRMVCPEVTRSRMSVTKDSGAELTTWHLSPMPCLCVIPIWPCRQERLSTGGHPDSKTDLTQKLYGYVQSCPLPPRMMIMSDSALSPNRQNFHAGTTANVAVGRFPAPPVAEAGDDTFRPFRLTRLINQPLVFFGRLGVRDSGFFQVPPSPVP
jgi:hypothetical protein